MRLIMMGVAIALAGVAPAGAREEMAAAPNCPADAQPVPAALAGWSTRAPLAAAGDTAELGGATLTIGRAVDLALRPTPEVRYALRPENPGGAASRGGMAGFRVDRAGTYRVAIGSAAWIDVVHAGALATSIAHGHGPACSGIRKMVDFRLEPGEHVLQIAGNGAPTLAVLVTRLP